MILTIDIGNINLSSDFQLKRAERRWNMPY